MHINDLPVEILGKIFSYLSTFKTISLVSRRFYNVACDLGEYSVWLNLNPRSMQCRSIKNTTRKIRNINIKRVERDDVVLIIDIVKKFSESLVDLNLSGGGRFELTYPEFNEILSSIPKVINLSLARVHLMSYEGEEFLPSKEDLNLKQLKMLSIEYCSDKIGSIFNLLPAGILSEFKFRDDSLYQLEDLIKKQIGIKKLILELRFPTFTNENLFDDLQLEFCELHSPGLFHPNFHIRILLLKQTKLKSLKLIEGVVSADLFDFITNQFTELESLSIVIPGIEDLKHISKLKNLKQLTLEGIHYSWERYDSTIETFAELDNSSITTLHINTLYYISATAIAALAKSLPNLRILRYQDYFDQVLQPIMEHFTFVECLEISCDLNPIRDYKEFRQSNYFNPKLIQLELYCHEFPFDADILKKLITEYPNLKKLIIQVMNFTAADFKLILEGFSKMESLSILRGAHRLNISDFNLLKDHSNIKFIALGDILVPREHFVTLRKSLKMFEVFVFSGKSYQRRHLQMAVNKNTFKSEKLDYTRRSCH